MATWIIGPDNTPVVGQPKPGQSYWDDSSGVWEFKTAPPASSTVTVPGVSGGSGTGGSALTKRQPDSRPPGDPGEVFTQFFGSLDATPEHQMPNTEWWNLDPTQWGRFNEIKDQQDYDALQASNAELIKQGIIPANLGTRPGQPAAASGRDVKARDPEPDWAKLKSLKGALGAEGVDARSAVQLLRELGGGRGDPSVPEGLRGLSFELERMVADASRRGQPLDNQYIVSRIMSNLDKELLKEPIAPVDDPNARPVPEGGESWMSGGYRKRLKEWERRQANPPPDDDGGAGDVPDDTSGLPDPRDVRYPVDPWPDWANTRPTEDPRPGYKWALGDNGRWTQIPENSDMTWGGPKPRETYGNPDLRDRPNGTRPAPGFSGSGESGGETGPMRDSPQSLPGTTSRWTDPRAGQGSPFRRKPRETYGNPDLRDRPNGDRGGRTGGGEFTGDGTLPDFRAVRDQPSTEGLRPIGERAPSDLRSPLTPTGSQRGPQVIVYGDEAYANNPTLKYLNGALSKDEWRAPARSSRTDPATGMHIQAPSSMNARVMNEVGDDAVAGPFARAAFKRAGRAFDFERSEAERNAPPRANVNPYTRSY